MQLQEPALRIIFKLETMLELTQMHKMVTPIILVIRPRLDSQANKLNQEHLLMVIKPTRAIKLEITRVL